MKKLLTFLVLAALAAAGAAWWWNASRNHSGGADDYSLTGVEYGALSEIVSATGIVQPRDVYPVGSEVAGKVVAVLADFNQVVEEGDVLLRLDDRLARDRLTQAKLAVELAQAGLRQAEAARANANKTLERERKRDPEVRNQTQIDLVEGHLRTAEAALEAAKVKVREAEQAQRQAEYGLSLTEVRAPVLAPANDSPSATPMRTGLGALAAEGTVPKTKHSFVVLDRKVSVNQVIGPPLSAHLFTLAGDLERIQVIAQVVEGDVSKVVRGQRAQFTVSGGAGGEGSFEGRVEEVRLTPTGEHGAVYYKTLIEARNERDAASGDWKLRPGQTVSVDVLRRTHEAVWKMPATALNFQPDDSAVTEAARAKLRQLQERPDHDQWKAAWVVGHDHKPWPVFVRLGGKNARGETGIQDGQFSEVLEWDPELKPAPDPAHPDTWPRPILGMPAPRKDLFSPPPVKL